MVIIACKVGGSVESNETNRPASLKYDTGRLADEIQTTQSASLRTHQIRVKIREEKDDAPCSALTP